MLQHLFVYGTLRKARDGSLHPFLREQSLFVAKATLPGKLFHVAGYPGAICNPASINHLLHGELYRLLSPEETLKKLDAYEECSEHFPEPHEYRRVLKRVALESGELIPAWVYEYQRPVTRLKRIESGDYFSFLPARHR